MSKEEIEIEKPKKIVYIVEKLLSLIKTFNQEKA